MQITCNNISVNTKSSMILTENPPKKYYGSPLLPLFTKSPIYVTHKKEQESILSMMSYIHSCQDILVKKLESSSNFKTVSLKTCPPVKMTNLSEFRGQVFSDNSPCKYFYLIRITDFMEKLYLIIDISLVALRPDLVHANSRQNKIY